MSITRILKNQTDQDIVINDLGEITVPASGQYNLTDLQNVDFSIQVINNSDDLKQAISDDKLLINDGHKDLSKQESLEILCFNTEFEAYNPNDYIYMVQSNMIQNIFINHTEEVYLDTSLRNAFVDTFKSLVKVASYEHIECDGAGIALAATSGTSTTQLESFDSITNWTADQSTTLSLETTIVHESTGSAKFTVSESVKSKLFKGFKREFSSSQDWTIYDNMLMWIYGEGVGERIKLKLVNDENEQYTQNIALKAGWQQLTFDISELDRNKISQIKIELQKNASNAVTIYCDDLEGRGSSVIYEEDGYIISNTISLPADVKEIFFLGYCDMPTGTSNLGKISLDGGSHWHSLDPECGDCCCWLDVTQWDEYSTFENLKNIVMKIEMSTTDTSVTPTVDDYLIMWKLDV